MLAIEFIKILLNVVGALLAYVGIIFVILDCVNKNETIITNRLLLISIIALLISFNI